MVAVSCWFFHTALEATSEARCRTYTPPGSPGGQTAKLERAPPFRPPTSSSHVPLRTQALRKPLSLKDKSFQKKMVGPCGAGRRSARSKTFQPVNATYVALTRRTAPRWPPGQKTFPARGAYAPSRERGVPPPPPPAGEGRDPSRCSVLGAESSFSALNNQKS